MSDDLKYRIESARALFRQNANIRAVDILENEVFAENAEALLLLGQIFDLSAKSEGGVARNPSKARKLWRKAVALGNTEAARELASAYYFGNGVKTNFDKAKKYWLVAMRLGDDLAQFELANFWYDDRPEKTIDAVALYQNLIEHNQFVGNSCTNSPYSLAISCGRRPS